MKEKLEKILQVLNLFMILAIIFIVYDSVKFFYYGLTDSFSGFEALKSLVYFEMWAFFLGMQIMYLRIFGLEDRVKELEDRQQPPCLQA